MKYTNVLLSSVIVLGSIGTLSTASTSFYLLDKSVAPIAAKTTSVNSFTFKSIPKFKKTKIVWKGNNITITANTLKQDAAADLEQNIIDTIVVTHGKEKKTLQTEISKLNYWILLVLLDLHLTDGFRSMNSFQI